MLVGTLDNAGMGFGDPNADIMIIGDNPPKKAVTTGQFGKTVSGIWSQFVNVLDVKPYYTFLIKAPKPKGKKRSPIKEARAGWPTLIEEIMVVKPKRLIVHGYHTTRMLCPGFGKLKDDHGSLFYNPELDLVVVPTFDPLVAYYDPAKKEYFVRDLIRAVKLERPEGHNIKYLTEDHDFFEIAPQVSVTLDVETTGLDPLVDRITMIGYQVTDWGPVCIMKDPSPDWIRRFHKVLVRQRATLLGHNLKFDLKFLSYGARELFTDFPVVDTMLMAKVAGQRVLSLKHLTSFLTDRPGSRAFGGFEDPSYLAEDVLSTSAVFHRLRDKLSADNEAVKLLNQMTRAFTEIEIAGIRVIEELLAELAGQLKEKSLAALAELDPNVNWNSPQQVAAYLQSQGVKLTEKTDTGAYSVAAEVLEELADTYPAVQAILDYRGADKLENYIDEYQETIERTGRPFVNPNYKLAGARSGRIACEKPNLQNVPKYIKQLFKSRWPGGFIGVVDLDQAELRVAGILSGDQDFANLLVTSDPHLTAAAIAFDKALADVTLEERKVVKTVVFGLIYGGSVWGLAKRAGVDEKHVEAIQKKLYGQFPRLIRFIQLLADYGEQHKEIISPYGRRRDLVNEYNQKGANAVRRIAINTPIQTTASDVTMGILVAIWQALKKAGLRSLIVGTVHDSIILDIHPDEVDQVGAIVQLAFVSLVNTPLGRDFELFKKIPFTGTFGIADTWYEAEGGFPKFSYKCSSLE